MSDSLAVLTDSQFNAEMSAAGKRYAARRADELRAEDPTRSSQRLVELLGTEADAAKDELRRIRDDG
jgi:hypothetical protein